MEQVTDLCTDGQKRRSDEVTNEHELYEQIGCLKMEVESTRRAEANEASSLIFPLRRTLGKIPFTAPTPFTAPWPREPL